uniref:Reverse transcriptase Ty1/copia-type domain-containing protein n=1 Tax=Tanacetum cinerariifolium TaxID=118510 RepID=A0A6L2LYB7_TANCI|nr:hypothetical protein [Tanacetum cinerariifolium]
MSKIYAEPRKIGRGNRRDNPRYPVSPRLPKINVTRWLQKSDRRWREVVVVFKFLPTITNTSFVLRKLSKSEDVPSYTIDTWTMNFHMEYLMALTQVWYPACYTRIGLKITGAKLKIMCSISLLKFTYLGSRSRCSLMRMRRIKASLAKFVSAASADPQEEQKKKAWALSLSSPISKDVIANISLDGLLEKYDHVSDIIIHREPFSDLKTVRSMHTTTKMRLKSRAQVSTLNSSSSSPMVLLANSTNIKIYIALLVLRDPYTRNWNMDTGASFHLNDYVSNLSTIFNSCIYPSVSVGDRASLSLLRSDAVVKILTSSLAHPDGVTRNPDAVSKACMTLSRYKARLVANGNTQLSSVDVDETFSLVVKLSTIRTILSLAISRHWPVHQLDRKYAIKILERVVSCNFSQTLVDIDSKLGDDGNLVCLYMHDPREPHFLNLKRILRYVPSTLDYGLQLFSSSTSSLMTYSDADLAGCPTTQRSTFGYCVFLGNNLPSWSSKRQPMLSLLVMRQSSMCKYAIKILERVVSCNFSQTLVDIDSKLGDDGNLVCLYMHDPREPHFLNLKRILRYVPSTLDYGLQLFSSSTSSLMTYSDADLAGCPTTQRSTFGYCVFLGNNLPSWSSKRQPMLSLLVMRQSSMHQRRKHIEIDIHFVRDLVAAGQVRILHVSSRYQPFALRFWLVVVRFVVVRFVVVVDRINRYVLYDHVMYSLALQHERNTRKDYDTKRGHHFTSASSSSSFDNPSPSYHIDDDNDEDDKDLPQEYNDTHTPSPIEKSSSPSPPNAPIKTPSTKDTSFTLGSTSSSFESKPNSSPFSSRNTSSPKPTNPFLDDHLDAPPRHSNPLPL